MHRRLVKLDEKNGWSFSEVDEVRLLREARLVVRSSSKMYRRTIRMEFTVSCSP